MQIDLKSSIKFIRGIQVVLIIGLIFIAYSMILPEDAWIEREIEINTGPELIFNHFNDLKLFNRWSPWYEHDSGVEYKFAGPNRGVGATMQWQSKDGSGFLEIMTSVPYNIVSSTLKMDDNRNGTSSVTIFNNRDNTLCRVVWSYEVRLDGVVQRYMGRFIDRLLGPGLERGLADLKSLAETGSTNAEAAHQDRETN